MGNLPSCCGIISKHVYPLELPKMAPFCMKITKNNSGGWPQYKCTPFNNNSFRYYNIYTHVHTEPGSVQIWTNILNPPPSPSLGFFFFGLFFFFFFFCFFKILFRIKINSLALVYLKINLVYLKINNLSRQNFPTLPSLKIKWSPPKHNYPFV